MDDIPRLYTELADWWPVLSIPEDYAEEAQFYQERLLSASKIAVRTMLELGSGGGNNASHLKKTFKMTLVDLSAGMLKVSQALNPECEHIQGDMRTVRLGRTFDAVFVHDAIVYMTTEADLRKAIETAYVHCKPGGVVLLAPDDIRETYKPTTSHGGHDLGDRALRYLEWSWDPDPSDTTYQFIMTYLLREGAGEVRCVVDKHVCGLFGREEWLEWMRYAGFEARSVPFEHSEIEPGSCEVFLGVRRG